MLKKLQPKDVSLAFSLVAICVITLVLAWVGTREFERRFARTIAAEQTLHWQQVFGPNAKDLQALLNGASPSVADRRLFNYTIIASGAYRYQIYNAKGVITGASQAQDVGKRVADPAFAQAARTGKTANRITSARASVVARQSRATGLLAPPMGAAGDQAGQRMRIVTKSIIPFVRDGRLLGAVGVYVDSTRAAIANSTVASNLKIGLAVLFLTLFILCGLFIWRNIHERNLDFKAVQTARDSAKAAEAETRAVNAQLEAKIRELTDAEQTLEGTVGELNAAQDELFRKSRLAALGQLTATVSHELRNPLGAVRTAAYLIDKKTRDQGLGLEPALARVENGLKRCDAIITELLDFTRIKSLSLEPVAFDEWIQAIVKVQEIPPAVSLGFDLQTGGTKVYLDPDRFQRVLINLVSNAAESMMDEKGTISDAFPEPAIAVRTRLTADRIEVTVSDNGPGISPDNIQKIFEPLFSTKSFGVGLGVPAVQQIMEQHGGGVEITSEPGKGAVATAWLPIANARDQAA